MTTMNFTTTRTTAIAAALLLFGCANQPSTEGQFGDSVRHMTGQQIYDLDAAYNPDPEPLAGGNPDRLNGVVDSHRNNAEDPTEDRGALTMDRF
jgi:hypothetical protein